MYRLLLLFSLLLGMALRCVLVTQYPFREDEALYSTWALHLLYEDPLFLSVWPDKPPIFIWLLSAAFWLAGPGDFTARWLNIGISVLTIPIVAATARRLWGKQAALFAGVAMALSPFAISFSSTAYTDPLLVLCGSVAVYFAVAERPIWAGVWLGLAIMTKQQGILYVPLVLYLILTPTDMLVNMLRNAIMPKGMSDERSDNIGWEMRMIVSRGLAMLAGLSAVVVPLVLGDSLRWAVAPSPWDLSVRNYGALTLVPVPVWLERFQAWWTLLWYFVGSHWGWGLLGLGGIVCLTRHYNGPHHVTVRSPRRLSSGTYRNLGRSERSPHQVPSAQMDRGVQWLGNHNGALLLWSIGFILLHVSTSVQIWDRYLLPLAPVLALLLGWLVAALGSRLSQNRAWVLWLFLLFMLMPAAVFAAKGQIPIGGDHGGLAGLDEAVEWIHGEQDAGNEPIVLYHQSLGSQYRFYLYDEVRRGQVDLRWYPHVTYLVDNAVKVPHRRKFLIAPAWAPIDDLDTHAMVRRVKVIPTEQFGQFYLMELIVAQPPCDWCISRERLQTPAK